MPDTSDRHLERKVLGGCVAAVVLLSVIGLNETATAWLLKIAGAAVWPLAVAWGIVRLGGFAKPEAVFKGVAGGVFLWVLLAPGGLLECRPNATGNFLVDWFCEPMLDSKYPEESAAARKRFWAGEP